MTSDGIGGSVGSGSSAPTRGSLLGGMALAALAALAVQLPIFDRWFNFMDEGHMVLFADMIANGRELYRDATVYPLPGAFYLLALVFDVFGSSILVSRWLVTIEFCLFVALLYGLVRQIVPTFYAWLAVGLLLLYRIWSFPHWQHYSYSTTALLVLLASILVLLRSFETSDRRTLGLAGLLFGLGVFCKQDYGAAAMVTILGLIAVDYSSRPSETRGSLSGRLVWFFVPAASVGLATALHFWRQDMFGQFIQLTVLNHFIGMAAYEYMSFPPLLPLFAQDPVLRTEIGLTGYMPGIMFTTDWDGVRESWVFKETFLYDLAAKAYFYGPFLLLAGGALRLFSRRRLLGDANARLPYLRELALLGFGAMLTLLVWSNKPQDYLHLGVLYWPVLCLAPIYLHALLQGRPVLRWGMAAVAIVPTLAVVYYTGWMGWRLRTMHPVPVPGERAGIWAQQSEAEMVGEVVDYIRANSRPDERVAVMPYFPVLLFLADREGPHASSYILWPFPEYPDRDARIVRAMRETDTRLLVYNYTHFHSFPLVRDYAPEVFDYLTDHFEIDRTFTYDHWGYKLAGAHYERELVAPSIVGPDGAGAAIRVEYPDRPPRPVTPSERETFIETDVWPFRPVMALRPTGEGGRTVLSVDAAIPPGARLVTAVSVNPQYWFKLPKSWVRFTLDAVVDGERHRLFARTLNTTLVFEDRGWFDVEIPLERWAGRTVTFEFASESERVEAELLWYGGWGRPTLVTTPEPATPPTAATPAVGNARS